MAQFLQDLSTFSKEEISKKFLDTFDTVLTDGDGVLWFLHEPMPGTTDAINILKALGKKIFLVSNNCTKTVDEYIARCKEINLNLEKDEIIIPSVISAEYLKKQNFKKKVFVFGTPGMIKEYESRGIQCSSDIGPDKAVDTVNEVKEQLSNRDHDVGAVVIDFDFNFTYMKMMKALLHLRKPDCQFIVGATDYMLPIEKNLKIIGPGGFISIMETMSGRKALVTGKPGTIIKDFIANRHPIIPERTLMIGDMMDSDMMLGTKCGFQKLLVLSGVATLEDAKKDSSNMPHYYISSLKDLAPLLPST